MDEARRRAYTYLLYCVMIDIRSASYTHRIKWWNPVSWVQAKRNMDEINKIADTFHNLPDFIANRSEDFDEALFWNFLNENLPDRYEEYHRIFIDKLIKQ